MKELLKDRKEKQARKPKFTRHAHHRKKRLDENWRRPRGLHNKLRLSKKSRGPRVRSGYRVSKAVRDLTADGKRVALVSNRADILEAEPQTHVLRIAKIGARKRKELLEEAKKQGFVVENYDIDSELKAIDDRVEKRSKKRDARFEKRAALAKKSAKKKDEKKESEAKDPAGSEDKSAQKKEQDKVLTKKES